MPVRDALRDLPASRIAEIADYLSTLHARPVGAERILVSSSGMAALMLVAQALIDAGDNFIIIIAPVWPNVAAAVSIMGGLAPGSAFGPMGEGCLRLCFARDPQQVAEAVARLRPLLD